MKRILLLLVTVVTAMGATAQRTLADAEHRRSASEEIKENRWLAGSNYLDYDRAYGEGNDRLTPAPKGYEPYYLTHYGRHGARWLLGDRDYMPAIDPLRKAKADGKITAIGLETLDKLERFFPTSKGRMGDLTTVGERQHHGIGKRMAEHFPEIFKTKGVKIDARSTVVQRCILSMIAECEELMAANPTARIHNDVSESLQYYLNQNWRGLVRYSSRTRGAAVDPFRQKLTHPERICEVMFTDQEWVRKNINAGQFMRHLFDVAMNMQSHDGELDRRLHVSNDTGSGADLINLFTDEELYDQWRIRNVDWYTGYGAAPVTGSVMQFSQFNLLKNIIETADTVTQPQATLRFGHEVCVMPLACLLELGNCGAAVENLDSLDAYWRNYDIFPMGCNVQLIFYRPKKGKQGDILVKALLNEKEMSLPVATDQHPYYRWADLREYYVKKLKDFEALEKESTMRQPLTVRGSVGKLRGDVQGVPIDSMNRKVPVVVIMHGFTGNRKETLLTNLADELEKQNVATVRFDFNGHGESEGDFSNMTIRNEIEDAKIVIRQLRKRPWVGPISVVGHSQGGVIATMVAGEMGTDTIASALLYAPAANIPYESKEGMMLGAKFDAKKVPEYVNVWGRKVGRDYILIAQNLPLNATAASYRGPVCILHGTGDTAVPHRFGEELKKQFPNSEIHLYEGENHGFGKARKKAVDEGVEFLLK